MGRRSTDEGFDELLASQADPFLSRASFFRGVRRLPLLVISVLALTLTLALGLRADSVQAVGPIQGDADCSQIVGTDDVGAILQYAGALTESVPCAQAANVNCDGEVDVRDALNLLQSIAGFDGGFPAYCTAIGEDLGSVTISIDTSIEPSRETAESMDGGPPPPVEVIVGSNGVPVEFVGGEIVYRADNSNDLQSFLDEHDATVIRDGAIPDLPGTSGESGVAAAGYYLLGLENPDVALDGLADDLAEGGIEGEVKFSNEAGARLMALAASDPSGDTQLSGLVAPLTEEHPKNDGGFINGEDTNYFQSGSGLDIGVTEAWRYMRYQDIVLAENSLPGEAVRIAVIDSGFALHQVTGLPLGGNRDYFPYGSKPLQYDAVDDDLTAGGPSFESGKTWHGSGAFGVCCAIADNQYGTAGTAGPYVQPVFIRVNDRMSVLADGVRIAQLFNPQVISISMGGYCSTFCGWVDGDIGDALVDYAADGGIALAGAGNDGDELTSDNQFRPCSFPAVVCVGTVDGLELTNVYNWGAPVDIWAPEGLHSTVTPESAAIDPNDVGFDELDLFNGTSSSTPFVAGIVAMMKELNPGLNKNGIISILQNTAHQVDDPRVAHGYINAKQALLAAAPNQPPVITNVRAPLPKETYNYSGELFRVDGYDPEPGSTKPEFMNGTIAAFLVDGDLLCVTNQLTYRDGLPGYQCVINDAPLGVHDVTIEVRDPFMGINTTEINEVTFVNTQPTVEILNPPDGDTFYATQSIEFDAYVFDPEEPIPFPQSRIIWESDIDGEIGTGSSIETMLSQGDHTITITATDTKGVATTASIALHILSGAGIPTVEITTPSQNPSFHGPGEQITFIGQATDPEDGPLTGASLQWYSSIDGFLGTGKQITTTLSGGSNCDDYRDHIITLRATDSDAHEGTDQIHVVVSIFC